MSDPVTAEVAVSIQAVDMRTEPWRGHLATGLLLDSDTVLVPAPPDALVDGSVACEVLVLPLPLAAEHRIERLQPQRLDALRVDGPDGPLLAAVIKLAQPSHYSSVLRGYDGCELDAALGRTSNDLWAALVDLGVVGKGTRSGPSESVLRDVPEWELAQWRDRIRTHEVGRLGAPPANWICFFTPKCHPCTGKS
jgi:hypothetical protein